MKYLSTYFDGVYKNNKEIEYNVRGSLTSLPKGNFSQFPDDYFIAFNYTAIEVGEGFLPFPQSGEGYLKKVSDNWVIGTLVEKNQIHSFREVNTPSFNWIKEIVLQAYEKKAGEIS